MKIYQIISEDYDQLARLNTTSNAAKAEPSTDSLTGSDTKGAVGKAVDTAKEVANTATGYLPSWLNIDFNTLALAIGTGLTVTAVAKMSAAGLSKVSSQYADKLKIYNKFKY